MIFTSEMSQRHVYFTLVQRFPKTGQRVNSLVNYHFDNKNNNYLYFGQKIQKQVSRNRWTLRVLLARRRSTSTLPPKRFEESVVTTFVCRRRRMIGPKNKWKSPRKKVREEVVNSKGSSSVSSSSPVVQLLKRRGHKSRHPK